MAEDGFRLPASSYEELTKIIKAYASFKEAVGPEEVSKVATKNPSEISRNHAFLVAVGLLEGKNKKIMTDRGRALARALDHNVEDEIINGWRSVISGNEFVDKLLAAVRIRKGMDPATLQSHIAYSAGQPKKPEVMAGARTLIDILKTCQLLIEEDGKIVAPNESIGGPPSTPTVVQVKAQSGSEPRTDVFSEWLLKSVAAPPPSKVAERDNPINAPTIAINIDVTVQCSVDEIETLGEKLRALVIGMSTRPKAAPPDIADTSADNAGIDSELESNEPPSGNLDSQISVAE